MEPYILEGGGAFTSIYALLVCIYLNDNVIKVFTPHATLQTLQRLNL